MAKDNRDSSETLKSRFCSVEKGRGWFAISVLLSVLGGYASSAKENSGPPPQAASSGYMVRATDEATAGTISGKILYSGKPVLPKRFTVTSDNSICGNTKEVYPVRIEQGGIADAVVWLDDIKSGKAFNYPSPVIDQKKCSFVPHVLVMEPGELKLGNTDLCLHNVHILSLGNREVNKAITPGGAPQGITLARPDVVKVRCDVHKWMGAYVIVAKNPYYAITEVGGKFRLDGVPPGHYHLKVWQETLGELDQEITVEGPKNTEADFTYRTSGL